MSNHPTFNSQRSALNPKLLFILTVGLFALPLFLSLGHWPVRLWDESRNVVNALEMLDRKEWLVTYFYGEPDAWNTKPPLLIWCMALSVKIFGLKEWAIRLPSALAGLATGISILIFLRNKPLAVLSVIVLASLPGFTGLHGTRTGDYDAMLSLFSFLYAFSIYRYLENGTARHLSFFFIFLTLAVLTKGVAGILLLPGIFLYILFKGKFTGLLKKWEVYAGGMVFIGVIGAYYYLREQAQPGYWSAVVDNELGGRYLDTLEGHNHPWYYFIRSLVYDQLAYWSYFFLPLTALAAWKAGPEVRKVSLYLFLISSTFLLLISLSQTKLAWYVHPVLPFLAILLGAGLDTLARRLNERTGIKKVLAYILVFALAVPAYVQNVLRSVQAEESPYDASNYWMSYYLRDQIRNGKDLSKHVVIIDTYSAHLTFYQYKSEQSGSGSFPITYMDPSLLTDSARALVTASDVIGNNLDSHNSWIVRDSFRNVRIYKWKGRTDN